MGKAYNIVNVVEVFDQEKFAAYVAGHLPTIEQYDGRFLVKGYAGDVIEGSWPNNVIVIHEFPSLDRFKEWYHSEEYRPWKTLRQSCAQVNAIVTEGI